MQIKRFIVFLLIGGGILGAALFAEAIGLDNDPGWGKGRIAILILGTLIIAWGIFYSWRTDTAVSILRNLRTLVFQNAARLFELFKCYWYTFPVLISVVLVYVWFASSGSWTKWHSATYYYADLAIGFKGGQLSLPTEPGAKLLSLPNPYDPSARKGVRFPIDYSLYNRKYYLYWGPVPALLLVLISPFTHGRVGDLQLVFAFVCGTFFLQFLILMAVWERFFRGLPKWLLLLSVLVIGLITPWTYILINEPNGRIYEAAISGAQFFLTGGLLMAALAFGKPAPSPLILLFAGILWGMAIGTRLFIAVPVAFLSLVIAYWILKNASTPRTSLIRNLLHLGLPLGLFLIGLGWYNWARFGSVAETGFTYALAGIKLIDRSNMFSPAHLFQNLYAYLLQPPAGMAKFPFLYPKEVSPVTGLLFIAPFTMFGILSAVILLRKVRNASSKPQRDKAYDPLDWMITSLLCAFSAAFFPLLLFFWIATRYVGDFMPALTLVSVLGFWQGYRLFQQRPFGQKVYLILGIILAATSVTVNLLLSLSVKVIGRNGM